MMSIKIIIPYGNKSIEVYIPLRNLNQLVQPKSVDTYVNPAAIIKQALNTHLTPDILENV